MSFYQRYVFTLRLFAIRRDSHFHCCFTCRHSVCNVYDGVTGEKSVSTLLAVNGTPMRSDAREPGATGANAAEKSDCQESKRARVCHSEHNVLASFLTELKQVMSSTPGEKSAGEPILELLKRLTLHTTEWTQHAYFDPESHTRTLV